MACLARHHPMPKGPPSILSLAQLTDGAKPLISSGLSKAEQPVEPLLADT
jgi:hypothetical protein